MSLRVVLCTAPNKAIAQQIANSLVAEKLAAWKIFTWKIVAATHCLTAAKQASPGILAEKM